MAYPYVKTAGACGLHDTLRARTGCHDRIFYRHRPKNTARKAGNIADWVTRFGAAYPQFLILDADSVMAGETLLALVALAVAVIRKPLAYGIGLAVVSVPPNCFR